VNFIRLCPGDRQTFALIIPQNAYNYIMQLLLSRPVDVMAIRESDGEVFTDREQQEWEVVESFIVLVASPKRD